MANIEIILKSEDINNTIYFLKMFLINFFTFYTSLRILNIKKIFKHKLIVVSIIIIFITILSTLIKNISTSMTSIICTIILLSILFSKFTNNNLGYSMLINVVSASINYIIYFISIIISFIPYVFIDIQNDYINLLIIVFIYIIFIYVFFKMRRTKNGFSFLQRNLNNEYFDILILNVSVILCFCFIILTGFDVQLERNLFIGTIIFSMSMFITIQKSLQLNYKQKLLVQELDESKKELEKKKQEIEQLEKENLRFSKISHSIAHKQNSLEYKLNELMLKNATASEIDIRDRIDTISKEFFIKTEVELSKTDILEIDDMLKYMQSECIKNKIDLELQLSGNIHHMINNYVAKEDLEILIADHIKNAIIAINHSDNMNKSILVRLGMIDGFYSLYVYDTGIEFEIDTLLNLGKKPSTTHSDNGGTGIGFMNTFDTLKKYKASIIINEYSRPSKNNYTKLIIIKFDKKNEFKICSYRSEKIKSIDSTGTLKVEKISF